MFAGVEMVFSCAWVKAGAPCLVLGPGIFCLLAFGILQKSLSFPQLVASPALGVFGVFLSGCGGRIWDHRCSQAGLGPCRGLGAAASRKIEELRSQQQQQEEVCLSQMFSSHQPRVISAGKSER